LDLVLLHQRLVTKDFIDQNTRTPGERVPLIATFKEVNVGVCPRK